MSNYTPDRWVTLKITTPEKTFEKVFAGWYGGFTGADSWKVGAPIVKQEDMGDTIVFTNESGSTYTCTKSARGMSAYMGGLLSSWLVDMPDGIYLEVL